MLFFLSPAKTLDFETAPKFDQFSIPHFLPEAADLISVLTQLTPAQVAKMMKLSDALAQLNVARFASWKRSKAINLPKSAKQAIYAFKGDVYLGLDAEQFKKREINYAQDHLRVLSGLYGLLRPLDVINPYRLEMGTKLVTDKGKDLYQFWGDKITDCINEQLLQMKSDVIVNLASNEYFKAINKKKVQAEIVTPIFKDFKSGQYKIISFFAKKARGMMAAYAINERIKAPDQLKAFTEGGYWFNERESTEREWVFYRDQVQD